MNMGKLIKNTGFWAPSRLFQRKKYRFFMPLKLINVILVLKMIYTNRLELCYRKICGIAETYCTGWLYVILTQVKVIGKEGTSVKKMPP